MGAIRKIAIAVLFISFFTFVALFGRLPALRNTPIGYLHRLIWVYFPSTLRRLDGYFTGGRLSSSASRLGHYLFNDKHPLVLIFFLSILSIASGVFIFTTWTSFSTFHHILELTLIIPPFIFTYLCVTSTSSHITQSNHSRQMQYYPYDYVLYHRGFSCRTCNFLKPARSKHCSICKVCVAKSDHHCAWVNNCIGRGNYHLFLLLLSSLSLVLFYGTYLAYQFVYPSLPPFPHLFSKVIFKTSSTPSKNDRKGYMKGISRVISATPVPNGVGLLSLFMAPLASGLLAYHVYLIWAGMTTNETSKWDDLREDMKDGVVFRGTRRIIAQVQHGNGNPVTGPAAADPKTEWPVSSSQIVVSTSDGLPPAQSISSVQGDAACSAAGGDADGGTEGNWERCWRLNEVDNIYDLGFWDNLRDVFVGVT